jgi:RimJ/RimL family protein N-acetyltransferase
LRSRSRLPSRSPELRYEPFAERHLELVEPLLADPEFLRFTRVPVPVPAEFARAWLAAYETGRGEGTKEAFAILEGEDLLGLVMAPRIDSGTLTAELGYGVVPAARGRGVATESLRFLTEWALGERKMVRLELMISVDNEASKRVAERCGYVLEGVLRSVYFKQGLRADTELWSRLATDH